MNLTVAPYGWGMALSIDVQLLLEDTASHLKRLMRDPGWRNRYRRAGTMR